MLQYLWMHIQVYLLRGFGLIAARLLKYQGFPPSTLTQRIRFRADGPPLTCAIFLPPLYPANINPDQPRFPAYLNLHGGAFVAGAPGDDAEFCTYISRECGCVVVSVGYGLAPERPWPEGVQDAAAAIQWLLSPSCPFHIDPTRISVGGFSAGANIAAAAAQLVPTDAISTLVLFYGVADLSRPADSWMGRLAREAYIPKGTALRDPLLSPLYAPPEAMPRRTISLIAGIDPSREDNLVLARQLENKPGKKSVWRLYEGVYHGWTHMLKGMSMANEKVKWEAYALVASELSMAWGA